MSADVVVVAAGWNEFREWLMLAATITLGVVTYLLWRSTAQVARLTGDAAQAATTAATAALRSAESAEHAYMLEHERWFAEQFRIASADARLVECHIGADPNTGRISTHCVNRGSRSISNVVIHVALDDDPWKNFTVGLLSPNGTGRLPARGFDTMDRLRGVAEDEMLRRVSACVTFTDADGRRWMKSGRTDQLAIFTGSLSELDVVR